MEAVPRVPPALAPLTWLAALLWVAAHAAGRGVGRLLESYESATSWAGRAALRGAKTVLHALGPPGRLLRRLLTPLGRALRRAWDRLGLRILLALIRPLGRAGRWLLARTRPALDRARRWALAVAARAEPLLGLLAGWNSATERAAHRLESVLRRGWSPAARAVTAAVATLRSRLDHHGRRPKDPSHPSDPAVVTDNRRSP